LWNIVPLMKSNHFQEWVFFMKVLLLMNSKWKSIVLSIPKFFRIILETTLNSYHSLREIHFKFLIGFLMHFGKFWVVVCQRKVSWFLSYWENWNFKSYFLHLGHSKLSNFIQEKGYSRKLRVFAFSLKNWKDSLLTSVRNSLKRKDYNFMFDCIKVLCQVITPLVSCPFTLWVSNNFKNNTNKINLEIFIILGLFSAYIRSRCRALE